MFGIAYPGQDYFGQNYPERSVVFDNASNSGYQASLSTYNFTHVVGLSARGLLVNVSVFAAGTVTSITYNSIALTFIRADTSAMYRNELWFLENPTYGSHTLTVNLSASVTSIASAASYGNVDQTNFIEANAGANGTGGTPTLSVTTVTAFAWVASGISTANTAVTPGSSQVSRDNNSGALGSGALADKGPINPPASTATNWSAVGVTDAWAVSAVALKPISTSNVVSGTGSVNAGFSVTGTGTVTKQGTGSINAGFSLVGVGTTSGQGAGTINAGFTLTGVGTVTKQGTGTVNAGFSLAGQGTVTGAGGGGGAGAGGSIPLVGHHRGLKPGGRVG